MSVRPANAESHVYIKGTMVSTLWYRPSTLHVSVVQAFGLPNKENKILTGTNVVYLTYDKTNDQLVHVYAQPPPPPHSLESYSKGDGCVVS
jgi:hypothetical protein